MLDKQNLLTPSFLMKYASRKFFKWVMMGLVPLVSVIGVLIAIQFILGGNPFEKEPEVDPEQSVSDPLHPAEASGPPMVYVPETPEPLKINEALPVYKILDLAPSSLTVISVDSFSPSNQGAAEKTLLYETNVQDASFIVSGYASEMADVTAYIQALENYNEYGTFSVDDNGREAIGQTPYSMFKLTVKWRAPG